MPNIRSQSITADALTIVASDGRTYSIDRAGLRALYQSQGGPASTRYARTVQAVKDQILAALGPEQIDLAELGLGFEESTGRPIDARWGLD